MSKENKTIKAALIDMDGVLYDSMRGHAAAWYKMFSQQGIATDPDEFFLYEGMTGGDTIDLIFLRELGRHASEKEKTDLYAIKAEFFINLGQKPMMPGAREVIQTLKEMDLKTVLVTGSAQSSLINRLGNDYPGAFPPERRVTAFDVSHGKPHPEPYLKGAEKAGAHPSSCIGIENAPLGVRAAKAAGCFTIAVMTGPVPRNEFIKEGADIIFESMLQLSDWLKSWNGKNLPAK